MSTIFKKAKIPLSVPEINGNEWKYIKECLDTNWVSTVGSYVDRFEREICQLTGAKYAVACVNGTSALHIALILAGVQPDDEVIVPTVTFISPINVVKYVHAFPIFMDCDDFYNMDAEKTVEFLENETYMKNGSSFNRSTNRRISAIIPVHIFGNAAWLDTLIPLCRERNIKLIEDASESLGTYYTSGNYQGRYTGAIGDIGCYSFNGNKIITTGGGGMIITNNQKLAERARYLTTQAKDEQIYSLHNEVGYNYRLTNIQAAMGVAQLEQLKRYIQIKQENFKVYKKEIIQINGLILAEMPDYASNNAWMYAMQVDQKVYGHSRDELIRFLADNNVQTRPLWHLNHLQKPYENCQAYRIERAHELWERTVNIPCSVNLSEVLIHQVIEECKKINLRSIYVKN